MKQLLFLLLFPCLAMAQYPGNAGQKITLGEQTTADGLVFRGVASIDTVTATSKITRANKQDTSAYLLLDTVTNLLWHYKTASNGWIQAGGGVSVSSFSGGTTGLTPSTATTGAVTLGGTLAVLNGGTNTGTLTANKVMVGNGTSGVITPTNLHWDNTNSRLGIGTNAPGKLFSVGSNNQFQVDSLGAISASINNSTAPSFIGGLTVQANDGYASMIFGRAGNNGDSPLVEFYKYRGTLASKTVVSSGDGLGMFLFDGYDGSAMQRGARIEGQVDGTPGASDMPGRLVFSTTPDGSAILSERMRITSAGEVWIGYTTDNGAYPLQVNGQIFATNATIATSDEKFKENITPLNKGLEIVNKLKPVTFNFISDTENNFSEYEEVGFIAQDVDRVLSTETFSKSIVKAADDSEPTSTMGLATQNLIPILVKAIQEQQALIKALEQRILIIENK